MAFHRFAVPTYTGGLPGGYDYLNNAIAGSPAIYDGPRPSGPNAGTYFIGFGEDARSQVVNRGLAALGENTDYIDDLMRRDIALPTRTVDAVAPGGGTSSVILPTGTFVGVAGHPNTQAGRDLLFEILDDADNEIIGTPSTGDRCKVTATSATIGTGFSGGTVTLTISPAIPATTTYRIYYGTRSNLAEVPADFLSNIKIRGAQEIDSNVEDFFRQTSRRDGTDNVLALVGSILETPDGVRRPKSAIMNFDANPDNSQASPDGFRWRVARDDAGVRTLAELFRDAYEPSFGLAGYLKLADGVVLRGATTLLFGDANLEGGPGDPFIRFSGVLADGDNAMRVLGVPVDSTTPGMPRSVLMRIVNGRGHVTVGDGTKSYGDWVGPTAIEQAWTWFLAHAPAGVNDLVIHALAGTFNVTTTVSIASGKTLTIKGCGRNSTIVKTSNASARAFSIATAALLCLEDLYFDCNLAGSAVPGITMSGSLRARGVTFKNNCIVASDPFPYSIDRDFDIVVCEDCTFLTSGLTTGNAGVNQNIMRCISSEATTTERRGFIFRNCEFNSNGTPAFMVIATGSPVSHAWKNFSFEGCRFRLPGAASTSATAMPQSGAFVVDGGTTNGALIVDDVRFTDCDVWAQDGAANTVLLHLYPLNATSLAVGRSIIGRVTIEGGTWRTVAEPGFGGTPQGSDFAPFFLQCAHPIVRNVRFISAGTGAEFTAYNTAPGYRGNGFYTDSMKASLRGSAGNFSSGGTTHAEFWATISASGDGVSPNDNEAFKHHGLDVSNISFESFSRKAGPSGVIALQSPNGGRGTTNVNGVNINPLTSTTGNTNLVRFWFFLVPGGTTSGPRSRGGAGSFQGINFYGPALPATGDQWHAFDGFADSHGVVGIHQGGRICLENSAIITAQAGGDGTGGTVVGRGVCGWSKSWGALDEGAPVYIRNNFIKNWRENIVVYASVTGFTSRAGPYFIEGNHLEQHTVQTAAEPVTGMYFEHVNIQFASFHVHRNRIIVTGFTNATTYRGMRWNGMVWDSEPRYPLHITDNSFLFITRSGFSNPLVTYGIQVTSSSGTPSGNICGNHGHHELGNGANSIITCKIDSGSGLALQDNTRYGGAHWTNCEVGHSTTNGGQYSFSNGNMIRNYMTLESP